MESGSEIHVVEEGEICGPLPGKPVEIEERPYSGYVFISLQEIEIQEVARGPAGIEVFEKVATRLGIFREGLSQVSHQIKALFVELVVTGLTLYGVWNVLFALFKDHP
jgi:hypothetical protein